MRSNSPKPTPFRSLTNVVGVADEHDRQAIGTEVAARDALHIIRRHAPHALGKRLQLLERQLVEQLIEHLRGNRVGRLDRQREVAGQVGLRALELALVDALALQLVELVDREPQRLGGRVGPRVGLGDDAAGRLVGLADPPTRRRSGRAANAAPAAGGSRLRRRES